MSIFKCKMCGGDLNIVEGTTTVECDYCGTKQTVPKSMDPNMQNLFNRANTMRMRGEFDKAAQIYEKIVQADNTQSDAYWGLILCKYGIEYVDDPATFKKIPTCHRASFDSIISDDDYKSALENADILQRAIYEEQAKEIDRIQKDILALAQNEEKYDVFICYKETDENGKRTQDSVIANDIYYELTKEGYKVFYAAITLEGKLGSAYEPIIFAALNSAKVMLAIGTKPEYFNAVWVKNEWSRFLRIIKNDRSKYIFPCYRDMDAYDLPEEFAHLQAQDMAKIGFINDLVRGIKKIIKKDEPQPTTIVKETIIENNTNNVESLLKRAFMFLEDGNWKSADEYCEKVLDQNPENANAYLGKLMSEFHARTQQELTKIVNIPCNNDNFQKALKYADDNLKDFLMSCVDSIKQNAFKCYQKWYASYNYLNLAEESVNKIIDSILELIKNLNSIEAEIENIKKTPVQSQESISELEKIKKIVAEKNIEKQSVKEKLAAKRHYLETLGFFSLSEKRNTKNSIIEYEERLGRLESDILNFTNRKAMLENLLSKQYPPEKKSFLLEEKEKMLKDIKISINEKRFKLADIELNAKLYLEAKKPNVFCNLTTEMQENLKAAFLKNPFYKKGELELKESILDILFETSENKCYTTGDFIRRINERFKISVTPQHMTYMLRYMRAEGIVKNIIKCKVSYYCYNKDGNKLL